MRQRSKLHWSKVVCRPWAIVVYNVEPKPAEKVHGQMQDEDCKGSSEGVAESCADHGKITESNSIKRKWVEIFNVSKVEKR